MACNLLDRLIIVGNLRKQTKVKQKILHWIYKSEFKLPTNIDLNFPLLGYCFTFNINILATINVLKKPQEEKKKFTKKKK